MRDNMQNNNLYSYTKAKVESLTKNLLVIKRDGRVVKFDAEKIYNVIEKAVHSVFGKNHSININDYNNLVREMRDKIQSNLKDKIGSLIITNDDKNNTEKIASVKKELTELQALVEKEKETVFEKNEEFAKAYEKAIKELEKDGTLAKLSEKYFGEDVFSYVDKEK